LRREGLRPSEPSVFGGRGGGCGHVFPIDDGDADFEGVTPSERVQGDRSGASEDHETFHHAIRAGDGSVSPVGSPGGVNGMWNIGVPVLGLLMLPVTLTVGPVAAYNVAMMLGLVVSGVSMAAALVPWTRRWAARIVAGALYAFSPFQIAHFSVGHLNIIWAILPPVLLYAIHVIFIHVIRSA